MLQKLKLYCLEHLYKTSICSYSRVSSNIGFSISDMCTLFQHSTNINASIIGICAMKSLFPTFATHIKFFKNYHIFLPTTPTNQLKNLSKIPLYYRDMNFLKHYVHTTKCNCFVIYRVNSAQHRHVNYLPSCPELLQESILEYKPP